jgi:hypothetical protein
MENIDYPEMEEERSKTKKVVLSNLKTNWFLIIFAIGIFCCIVVYFNTERDCRSPYVLNPSTHLCEKPYTNINDCFGNYNNQTMKCEYAVKNPTIYVYIIVACFLAIIFLAYAKKEQSDEFPNDLEFRKIAGKAIQYYIYHLWQSGQYNLETGSTIIIKDTHAEPKDEPKIKIVEFQIKSTSGTPKDCYVIMNKKMIILDFVQKKYGGEIGKYFERKNGFENNQI